MPHSQDIIVESHANHLSITLNRPEQANALSPGAVEGIMAEFQNLIDEPLNPVRSVVLKGNGRHFCAGFDLSEIEALSDGDLLWRFLRIEAMLQMIHHAPVPVLALAQGQVIGAGADLFAACSSRVAAPGSQFRMPGWHFELALGTRRLTDLLGTDNARLMLIDATSIDATKADQIGLATSLAEREQWSQVIEAHTRRASVLTPFAVSTMLALTNSDTRALDVAAIVASAGRPGLKNRILAFQQSVKIQGAARHQERSKPG